MEFIGLVRAGSGVNYVFNDCCPQTVTIKFKTSINDNPISLHTMYTTPGSCAFNILEVAGQTYANPFTYPVIMQADSEIEIKLEYCSCLAVGSTEMRSIQVQWQDLITGTGYSQSYAFTFESADIATAVFTTDVNTVFHDCSNDCGRPDVIATFTNPSAFDVNVYQTATTPFTITANGSPLIYDGITFTYYFTIPGNGSVTIEASNPSCTITTDTDFVFNYDICGSVIGVIYVDHEIVWCDTCGIDCKGITINTGGPYPNLAVVKPWSGDYITHTWSANGIAEPLQSVTPSGQNTLTITTNTSVLAYQSIQIYPTLDIDYSMVANNGDLVDITYYFYSGHQFAYTDCSLSFYCLFTGNYYSITSNIQPATWYIATVTDTFNYPGVIGSPAFGGYFSIDIPHGTLAGDQFVIYYAGIRVQKKSYTYLLDPTSLNCSDLSLYNQTAIGDSKTITYHLTYGNGFQDNTRIWFNPWMYSPDGNFSNKYYGGGQITEPSSGWIAFCQSSWIGDGLWHNMNLVANGFEQSQRNGQASIEIINANEFKIHYYFYVIEDVGEWIGQTSLNNNNKLLYSCTSDLTELNPVGYSVYNSQKKLASLFYIVDPNVNIGLDPLKPIPYECSSVKFVFFANRFWNKGIYLSAPEMSNPQFILTRNSSVVNDLSLFGDTKIAFRIGHTSTVNNVVFWLFDVSQNDNSIYFYDNYDSSRALIPDVPTPSVVIDNHIVAPSTAVTSISPAVYEVTAHIGNGLNATGKYRIGAICYDNTNKIVNSFISDIYTVNTIPDKDFICSELDTDSHWLNYNQDFNTTCFSPTIKERISNQVTFGPGTFESKLTTLGMPTGGSWLDYITGVTLNIYQQQEDYPAMDKRTYFFFKQYMVARNTSIPGNWENPYPYEFEIQDSGSGISTSWSGRVLWDGSAFNPMDVSVGPMNQYQNRSLAGPSAASYITANNVSNDWSDKDIFFEYNLVFDLAPLVGRTMLVILTQINVLHPIAEETTPSPFSSILNDIKIFGYKSGSPEQELGDQVCDTSFDYLIIRVYGSSISYDNFIALFEKSPYSNGSIVENNASSGNFIQLTASSVYSCDATFNGLDIAEYRVDLSQLTPGTYKFSGLRIIL